MAGTIISDHAAVWGVSVQTQRRSREMTDISASRNSLGQRVVRIHKAGQTTLRRAARICEDIAREQIDGVSVGAGAAKTRLEQLLEACDSEGILEAKKDGGTD